MFSSIRRFIERGRKGFCNEDLWSFDNWLSGLIARGLREFKKNCYSYPNDIDNWDEWMSVLDEMIECFEEQTRGISNFLPSSLETYKKRKAHQREKLHKGFELLKKYYYDLWD